LLLAAFAAEATVVMSVQQSEFALSTLYFEATASVICLLQHFSRLQNIENKREKNSFKKMIVKSVKSSRSIPYQVEPRGTSKKFQLVDRL
jgi:hypothetical protein